MTPAPTPARLRLRRRLLVLSAAPALIMLLVAAKLISVVVAGNAAQRHYDSGDIGDGIAEVLCYGTAVRLR